MGRRGRTSFLEEEVFFVTTTVIGHTPVFKIDACCEYLIKNIKYYRDRYQFDILGYVIMPSHFHWIVRIDRKNGTLSDIMRDIKKYSAWDVMKYLEQTKNDGFLLIFESASQGYPGQRRKMWMSRFDDVAIRSLAMLEVKLEYIHNNPVKAGLVELQEQYKYSSARNYMLGEDLLIEVQTQWLC